MVDVVAPEDSWHTWSPVASKTAAKSAQTYEDYVLRGPTVLPTASTRLLIWLACASATRDCTHEHVLVDTTDGEWQLHNCSVLTLSPAVFLSEGHIAALADALADCSDGVLCPTSLALQTVPLNYEGSRVLAMAIANGTLLTSLALAWNAVHVEGTLRLTEALATNRTALTSLTLDSNGIGDVGAAAVAGLAAANGATRLRHLSLAANLISDEGARALAGAIRAGAPFVSLDLRRNRITELGLAVLVDAVEAARAAAGGARPWEAFAFEGNPAAAAEGGAALLDRLRTALDGGQLTF